MPSLVMVKVIAEDSFGNQTTKNISVIGLTEDKYGKIDLTQQQAEQYKIMFSP